MPDDLDIAAAMHRLVLAFQHAGLKPPKALVLSDGDQLYRLEGHMIQKHGPFMVKAPGPMVSSINGVELRVASY